MHAHHKGDSQLGLRKVCGYVALYVWLILTTTIGIGKINSETFLLCMEVVWVIIPDWH